MASKPIQRWIEIGTLLGTLLGVLVGGYLFMVAFQSNSDVRMDGLEQRFDRLEAELLAIAEAERIRDDEWEDDDERRVTEQDLILQAVRVTQDQITSSLAEQTVLLTTLTRDGDLRFAQREDRFEELESEHKATRAAVAALGYYLGVVEERTRLIHQVLTRGEGR